MGKQFGNKYNNEPKIHLLSNKWRNTSLEL